MFTKLEAWFNTFFLGKNAALLCGFSSREATRRTEEVVASLRNLVAAAAALR